MLVTNGRTLHVYEELAHGGGRLGRHLVLDARSLAYTVEAEIAALGRSPAIRPIAHDPVIPILDQSDLLAQGIRVAGRPDALGSCTGNAGSYALSSGLGASRLSAARLAGFTLDPADAAACERFAIELYHQASVDDGVPGDWPPTDTGSSGLGVCRALRAAKLIGSYRWATTLRGAAVMLQAAGAIIGMPWLAAFSEPDGDGFIDADPAALDSQVVGGHELYIARLESWDERDPRGVILAGPNSWTAGWGADGWWRMRGSTYLALRQQVDLKQIRVAA